MFFRRKTQEASVRGGWLKVEPHKEDVFVRLSGNLNQTLDRELRDVLHSLLKRSIQGAIVLQLSNVYFLDATIAATFASFVRRAEQGGIPVEIWDASPVVNQVFASLGLESLLKSHQETSIKVQAEAP